MEQSVEGERINPAVSTAQSLGVMPMLHRDEMLPLGEAVAIPPKTITRLSAEAFVIWPVAQIRLLAAGGITYLVTPMPQLGEVPKMKQVDQAQR